MRCSRSSAPPPRRRPGGFDAEIVPLPSVMKVADKETGAISDKPVTLKQDEGNRADTTLAGLQALKTVFTKGQRLRRRRVHHRRQRLAIVRRRFGLRC